MRDCRDETDEAGGGQGADNDARAMAANEAPGHENAPYADAR